jgi:methyl-accepting chemotaxis protein
MFHLKSLSPISMIFCLAAILLVCVAFTTLIIGSHLASTLATSLAFFVFGGVMARSQPKLGPVGAAIALIGQAIAFTAAFQGHPWQLDSHMMFFALLACLVGLRSIASLLAGTIIIALHHLSLSFIMPSLIFPSGGFGANLARTAFHAVIVLMETAALVTTVHQLNRAGRNVRAQREALENSLKDAGHAQIEAMRSKESAETAQKEAIEAQSVAEVALEQVRRADEIRKETEHEKQKSDEERRRVDEAKSKEQAQVVDTLRVSLTRLEGGDLTTRITQEFPEDYETLRAEFNAAMQTLEKLVSVVAQRSEQMDREIHEISTATNDLARRTEAQAQHLNETSAALDGLTKSVRENATSVENSNLAAQMVQSNAKASSDVVSKASQAMKTIKTESNQIGEIVELIEGISFQTNLLALNAGVEAARAGEAGRGFAVVASEVRALAQRSSESVTSIRALIERSGVEVENGSEQIAKTVISLGSVEISISEITSQMDMITSSTQDQRDQILSLNSAIADMSAVTQKNAAMFEETSAACKNLASGAKTLHELTQHFQVSGIIQKTGVAA